MVAREFYDSVLECVSKHFEFIIQYNKKDKAGFGHL